MVERSKSELIKKLSQFQKSGDISWKGERAFSGYFAEWLENNPPTDNYYQYTGIYHYIPGLLSDAYENLRSGQDEITVYHRQNYLRETDNEN
jgi:hypothetical protein